MPIRAQDRSLLILTMVPERAARRDEYIPPPNGCVGAVVEDLTDSPQSTPKILLVGARGGGKSSEMREIERQLCDGHGLLVSTVDLRASGISPSNLSAFDLLYMAGLAVLRGLPDGPQAESLFRDLGTAYAGKNREALGTLQQSREGLASFAGAAAAAATLIGAGLKLKGIDVDAATTAAAAAITGTGAATGLILEPRKRGVVPETSAEGRDLMKVCGEIAHARRDDTMRSLCVMIDGLEEMNGESNERFRQIFEQTSLLSMMPWSAVIAAPPCTLTETKSVEGRGYSTYPVWGFRPNEPERMIHLLEQRFRVADIDPRDETSVEPGALATITAEAGTLPRHAIYIAQRAVKAMRGEQRLSLKHAQEGVDFVGQRLCMALTSEDYDLLGQVHRTKRLPASDAAARLFADGRILVCPPDGENRKPTWTVHPLVLPELDNFGEERATGASGGGDAAV